MCSAMGSGCASSTTRPPTAHHLGKAVGVEGLGDLSKNGPELGLERGAVLPVEGRPDSRPVLVQPRYERSRDGIRHVGTLARRYDDNLGERGAPGPPRITASGNLDNPDRPQARRVHRLTQAAMIGTS